MSWLASLLDALPFLAVIWLFHLIPGIVPLVIWWRTRRRIRWHWVELFLFVVPYCTWAVLFMVEEFDKTWGNVFWEPIALGVVAALALAGRALIGNRIRRGILIAAMYVCVLATAVAIYLLVPEIPVNY